MVEWPESPPNLTDVYEFLSFSEFHRDLRDMVLREMELWASWGTVGSLLCTGLIALLKRITAPDQERQETVTEKPDSLPA